MESAVSFMPLPECAGGPPTATLEVTGAAAAPATAGGYAVTIGFNDKLDVETAQELGNYGFNPLAPLTSASVPSTDYTGGAGGPAAGNGVCRERAGCAVQHRPPAGARQEQRVLHHAQEGFLIGRRGARPFAGARRAGLHYQQERFMIQSLLQMRDTTPCPRCASGSAKCWAWTSPCRCRCCCARSRTRLRRRPHHLARPARLPGRAVRRPPHAPAPRRSRGRRAVGDGPGRQGRRRHAALGQGGLFHRGLGNTGTTRKRLPGMPQPGRSASAVQKMVLVGAVTDKVGSRLGGKVCNLCGCVVHKKIRLPTEACPDTHPVKSGLTRWDEPIPPRPCRPEAPADRRGGLAGCRRVDPPFQPAASSRIMSAAAPRSSRSANWYCPR